MPTRPARDCLMERRRRKFCEPERTNWPGRFRLSAFAWMAEKSSGAYCASSMMDCSGRVATKLVGSTSARARTAGSLRLTYR